MAQWNKPYRPERGYTSPKEKRSNVRASGRTALRPRVRQKDLSSHTDPLARKALRKLGRR